MTTPILEIRGLRVEFATFGGRVKAIDGIDLEVRRDETLGIVGESGCGKSVTAMSILRLLPQPPAEYKAGEIVLHLESGDVDLLKADDETLSHVRGNEISMIFQEPMTSLNPVMTVGAQLAETTLKHQDLGLPPLTRWERVLESRGFRFTRKLRERRHRALEGAAKVLKQIGLPDPASMLERYPHELSGGMRQRVMIAMAVSCRPKVLIADEPTTALDVTVQAQIIELMKELKRERGSSIMLITHHLGVVAEMCDRVVVMYAGQIMEEAPTRAIFHAPHHPYTVGLLKSIPSIEGRTGELPVIPGRVPDLMTPPSGCRFHPRCPFALDICKAQKPPLVKVGAAHEVACHLWDGTHEVPEELKSAGVGRLR